MDHGSQKVRLISWNVNGRYGRTLPRQLAVVRERGADVVALQEVRAKSLTVWREGLKGAGLVHVLDSSNLTAVPSLSGREYRRIYFNLVASRWPLRRLPGLQLEFPERYLAASVGRAGADFEIHVAHLPPGSKRGLVKVEMFEALNTKLARPCERPRILCGDFNTPRAERDDGTVEFWGARHPPHTERWDKAERSVLLGLGEHDLPDVFRALNGYTATDGSWFARRGGQSWGRRYDHIFASRRLMPTACRYLHEWREHRLSDHSAIEADFAA
jgi:exonuclease III